MWLLPYLGLAGKTFLFTLQSLLRVKGSSLLQSNHPAAG